MKGMKTLRSGRNRRKWIYVLLLMGLLGLSGCGSPSSASMDTSAEATSEITQAAETSQEERTELVKTGSMELQYAENFTVDYYEDGYKMLTTLPDSQRYLLVPEGQRLAGRCGPDPFFRAEAGELVHPESTGCHGGRGHDLCRKIQ